MSISNFQHGGQRNERQGSNHQRGFNSGNRGQGRPSGGGDGLTVHLPEDQTLADVEIALKKLKSLVQKSGMSAEIRKRKFFVTPAEEKQQKRRSKEKAIAKFKKKERKRDGKFDK